jgi:uncharacterized membrane protein YccF (DUF307 family)
MKQEILETKLPEMYCQHCGTSRADGRYCPECGGALELPPLAEVGIQQAQLERPEPALATMLEPREMQSPAPVVAAPLYAGAAVGSGAHPIAAPLNNATNVTVNVSGPQIVYQDKTGHGILLRAAWFLFIGWWVGQIWLGLAWLLNLTIIGLPLGLAMINKLPKIMTLKSQQAQLDLSTNADGTYTLTRKHVDQKPFWMRALYFVLVGWWASLLWAEVAWLFCLFIVTIPVGFIMFNKMPAVTTLARY